MMSNDPRKRRDPGYVPLDPSGNDYASGVGMSEIDRAALEAAQNDWYDQRAAGNQEGMAAAHQRAEEIRRRYNYSGGADGSQYLPYGSGNSYPGAAPQPTPGFEYGSAPEYVNRYQPQIDALMGDIMNRPDFSYNPDDDPSYQAYTKQYVSQGRRSAEDVMGLMSAQTGGSPSTSAAVAAQQASDAYAAQLTAKIPELERLAYGMYMDEGNAMRQNLNMLMGLENADYNRYMGTLGQWNADRDFAYGTHRDQINDQRYNDELAYDRWSDQWERDNYVSERDQQNALLRAELLAQSGDFSGYAALGMTDQQIAQLNVAYQQEQAVRKAGGGGGGPSRPRLTAAQTLKALEDGYVNEETKAAFEYYYGQPWDGDGSGGGESRTMQSIINLGYGPISEKRLAELVASGEVEEYEENGVRLFRRRPDAVITPPGIGPGGMGFLPY